MQVERVLGSLLLRISGERVSKTQITNPTERDNKSKGLLIPNGVLLLHDRSIKDNLLKKLSPEGGSAAD